MDNIKLMQRLIVRAHNNIQAIMHEVGGEVVVMEKLCTLNGYNIYRY